MTPIRLSAKAFYTLVSLLGLFSTSPLFAQVELRDTLIMWQHHAFDLNSDYSMGTYSTVDSDIEGVVFTDAKVIENELIRLIILPEYGARVLSFYYKPTGHEYLYQSECGSAYGIGQGNFYYDWLMVYGGIFPTFPESEHGKTWLLPWSYSVLKQQADTVTIRMEYTDTSGFSGTPWRFNNGITNLTCQVDVSVYSNSSIWDFDVNILNNQATSVAYEYWTCTTLAPGSDASDTGTPLNSEIVIPAEQYFAGWSPGGWIGSNGATYSMADIDHLYEWNDMGIAYADNFSGGYWGVINHENEEGIFRVSDNVETYGLKLWTWGNGNIDNDLFDFSNGGADNYIELWAGVSEEFFTDAFIGGNTQKSWKESYCPTVNVSSICNMSQLAGVGLIWEESSATISYELNTFHADREYTLSMTLSGNGVNEVITEDSIGFEALGHTQGYSLAGLILASGTYMVNFELFDELGVSVLTAEKTINLSTTSIEMATAFDEASLRIMPLGDQAVRVSSSQLERHRYKVFNLNGQLLAEGTFRDGTADIHFPSTGLYLLAIEGKWGVYGRKLWVQG